MLPQQFTTDIYANAPQFVDHGYAAQFSQNPEPGPSAAPSHSPPSYSRDNGSTTLRRSAQRPRRKRSAAVDDNPNDSPESASASASVSQKTVPKKKKANRACFHCQKAHLTCDDSRPCQRCIKRGLADKCTEGLRKKAKYLLDEEELAALKQQQQQKSQERTDPGNEPPSAPQLAPHHPLNTPQAVPPDPHPDPLFNLAFDPAYTFGSEAANLEYSILSAILGNPSPPDESSSLNNRPNADAPSSAYPQFANPDWPAPPPEVPPRTSSPTISPSFLQQQQSYGESPSYHTQPSQPQTFNHLPPPFSHPPTSAPSGPQGADSAIHQPQAQMHYSLPPWNTSNAGAAATAEASAAAGAVSSYTRGTAPGQAPGAPYQPTSETQIQVLPLSHNQNQAPGQASGQRQSQTQGLAPLSPPPSNSSPGTPLAGEGGSLQFHLAGQSQPPQRFTRTRNPQQHQTPSWGFSGGPSDSTSATSKGYASANGSTGRGVSEGIQGSNEASSVYNSVTRRYDYTQGYHYLMRHLHARFDKNDILRVVRALAIVRPSLIALQMPLTEEDEVFVEKCFQRSLVELDKLISFGGTPTVVWRRTGEICLVGFEFTMLTEWTREELLGRRKFIYELFETQSTVEYYEKFAAHAFENTTQSVISHCVLLKPSGAPVPCAFCFSIRRDIFDLPNMIIGQWLPLL